MTLKQDTTPLYDALCQFNRNKSYSFHVPGHKNGKVFPKHGHDFFEHILQIDLTELSGLDDLHAPQEVIREAQQLATDFFKTEHTFFLIGGSTVGNLAMILATCQQGDKVIVQRNSHKSIMNGLELANAHPIFIAPEFDQEVNRYTNPSLNTLERAIKENQDAQAVILTYPDYFGRTYPLEDMIHLAHQHDMLVLIDEAHGVHFSLGSPFPFSALELGADIVVQSAHKMAPAMTMASYLHINSKRMLIDKVAYYLKILQSSSPSYPLLASLDLGRYYLATITEKMVQDTMRSVENIRTWMSRLPGCQVLPISKYDDPAKITLQVSEDMIGYEVAHLFEQEGIYPELATHNQILFIHGLAPIKDDQQLKKSLERVGEQLKIKQSRDIMSISSLFYSNGIQQLALSYSSMKHLETKQVPLKEAVGRIAAEAIIPYPPGIPIILKGEKVTNEQVLTLDRLIKQGATIQHDNIEDGIYVFEERSL